MFEHPAPSDNRALPIGRLVCVERHVQVATPAMNAWGKAPSITIRCQCDVREHLEPAASSRYGPWYLADRVDAYPFVAERGVEAPRSQGFLDLVVIRHGETQAHSKSQFAFPPQPHVGTHGA